MTLLRRFFLLEAFVFLVSSLELFFFCRLPPPLLTTKEVLCGPH